MRKVGVMGGIGGRGDRTVTSGGAVPENGTIVDLPLVGSAELIDLLTAAAAPVQPHELSWEHGARTVFRSEVTRWPSTRRRGRTAIVGLGMAAAVLTGSTGLAAATGFPAPAARMVDHMFDADPSAVPSAPAPTAPALAAARRGRTAPVVTSVTPALPNHSAATGNAAAHTPERTIAGIPTTPGPDAQTSVSDQPAAIPAPTNGAGGTAGAPAVTSTTSPTVTVTTSNTGGSSDGNAGTGNGGAGTNRGGNQGTGNGATGTNPGGNRGGNQGTGNGATGTNRGTGRGNSGNGGTGTNRGGNQGTGTGGGTGTNRGGNRGTGPGKGTRRKGTGRGSAKGGGANGGGPDTGRGGSQGARHRPGRQVGTGLQSGR